jgi:hypothetical protein
MTSSAVLPHGDDFKARATWLNRQTARWSKELSGQNAHGARTKATIELWRFIKSLR